MKRNNIEKCKALRRNHTDAEKKLWMILRNRQLGGVKFRRQFPVGRYVLDFYAPEYKLGIEADGGQHYCDVNEKRDELRTRDLLNMDIQMLRFSNLDILKNIQGVCELINEAIEKRKYHPPHPNPLPKGERR